MEAWCAHRRLRYGDSTKQRAHTGGGRTRPAPSISPIQRPGILPNAGTRLSSPGAPLLPGGWASSPRRRSARCDTGGAPPLLDAMLEGSAAAVTSPPRGTRPGTTKVVERDEEEREAGEGMEGKAQGRWRETTRISANGIPNLSTSVVVPGGLPRAIPVSAMP
jgi:hypothetical protein